MTMWRAFHIETGDSFTMPAHDLLRGLLDKTIIRMGDGTARKGLWTIRKVGG